MDIEILSLADFEGIPEIEETGETFRENALKKAEASVRLTGEISLADDSGLEVDVLGGKPGVRSARFGGAISDEERNEKLLGLLSGVPYEKRTARFRCVVALVTPEMDKYVTEGVCEGIIAFEPKGKYGFGYDPIFYLPAYKRTMAQLTPKEKNLISHRAKALNKMRKILEMILKEEHR